MEFREHLCAQLPRSGVSILRSNDEQLTEGWRWYLEIERTATEQHLEEFHVLEEIGETVWNTQIGITRCPFCGLLLEPGSANPPADAWFRHLDHSGWDLKII